MQSTKSKKIFKKVILITEIRNLREIINYLLNTLDKEKISLEFIKNERI